MLFIFQERFSAGSNNVYVFAKAISMPLFYLLLTFCTSFILTIELISFPYKPIKLKHDDPIYYYYYYYYLPRHSVFQNNKSKRKYIKLNGSRETKGRVICELYLPILYC